MTSIPKLRTLLVLGRVSNLPTVWSNCLAGWLLGGGGEWSRFTLLCSGATLLYLGGMYLNDAFDAAFDAQHRRQRPIPSGAIAAASVWRIGIGLLIAGVALIVPLGTTSSVLAVLLCCCIVLYDAVHKAVTLSPVLMAMCRLLLYLLASSSAWVGLTGLAVWAAVALACYIVGLSYLARNEATGTVIQRWPQFLLAIPIPLAWLVNDGPFRQKAMLLSFVVVLWVARSLRNVWMEPRSVPRAVSGLLAGIVWIDLLAVADAPRAVAGVFVVLFLLALGFQRAVPAT